MTSLSAIRKVVDEVAERTSTVVFRYIIIRFTSGFVSNESVLREQTFFIFNLLGSGLSWY